MSAAEDRRDDEVEEEFFSEPRLKVDDRDEVHTDPRGKGVHEAIEQAFVNARRARFARYVKAATCAAALICAAAFARTMWSVPSPPALTSTQTSAVTPSWAPSANIAADATRERRAARAALDRNDADAAIAAAARSIALDPSAGATWLLLGESYERANRPADAKKAYRACIDEAKSDVDTCMAHLR